MQLETATCSFYVGRSLRSLLPSERFQCVILEDGNYSDFLPINWAVRISTTTNFNLVSKRMLLELFILETFAIAKIEYYKQF